MTIKHTPAPWFSVAYADNNPTSIRIVKPQAKTTTIAKIIEADIDRKEALANARLVAASPEMLEVLKALVSYCHSGEEGLRDIVDSASRVIAKVENRLNNAT